MKDKILEILKWRREQLHSDEWAADAILSASPQPTANPSVNDELLSACPHKVPDRYACDECAGGVSDIHSCSYFCDRPECVRMQRDELRQLLELANKPAPLKVPSNEALWSLWVIALGGGGFSLREVVQRFAELLLDEVQKGGE